MVFKKKNTDNKVKIRMCELSSRTPVCFTDIPAYKAVKEGVVCTKNHVGGLRMVG